MKADGGWRSWVHCGPSGDPWAGSPLTIVRRPQDYKVVQRPTEGEKEKEKKRKSRKRNGNNWSITDEVKGERSSREPRQDRGAQLKKPFTVDENHSHSLFTTLQMDEGFFFLFVSMISE